MEDYLVGEGPRVTVKRPTLPVTSTSTTPPTTTSTTPLTTTSRPKLDHPAVVSYDNNHSGTSWLNLKSPEIHQKSTNPKFQPPQVVNETNQQIVSTISSDLEYPATTTSVPLESTIEPEEEKKNSSTWPTTDQSTDPFYLTTSTPLIIMASSTTDNDELSTTYSSTDDPLTTPSDRTTAIRTTLMESSSTPLSDVVASTTQQPPSISHVVAHNVTHSGQKFAFNRFKTFQRSFLKFLKLFS